VKEIERYSRRLMRELSRWVLVTLILVAVGCDTGEGTSQIARTGTPETELKEGQLDRTPAPLTIRDVRRHPHGSPEETFLRLWFYAQWGDAPGLVSLYDAPVRRALGDEMIAGAYASNRPYIVATLPRIMSVDRRNGRTLITVDLFARDDPVRHDSFLLARRGRAFRVVYDTFLLGTVGAYAQQLVQERIDPNARTPSPRAVAAGTQTLRRFRGLYLDYPGARVGGAGLPR
jgi:hypothetical protein